MQMFFWPGTKIVKSVDNDFNWKGQRSDLGKDLMKYFQQSSNGKMGAVTRAAIGIENGERFYMTAEQKEFQKSVGQLSKSKPTKFNGKGKTI